MICFVYILYLANHSHYTGITNYIKRRFDQHQSGQCYSTQKYLPCRLIWSKECKDRKEARKLEVRIKKRGAKRFLLDIKFKTYPHPNKSTLTP